MIKALCVLLVMLCLFGCSATSPEELQMQQQEQYLSEEEPAPEAHPAPAVAELPDAPSVAIAIDLSPEPLLTPTPSDNEEQGSGLSTDLILSILKSFFKDEKGLTYSIKYHDPSSSYWMDVTSPNGRLAEIAQSIVNGDTSNVENWESIVDALVQVCNGAKDMVVAAGDNKSNVVVNLVNERNTDNYLVTVFNGIVTFDCTK